jgi:hypothetical protein
MSGIIIPVGQQSLFRLGVFVESHGGKSTMLVGSMFHWYKAKHPKSTRISIGGNFGGSRAFRTSRSSQNFHKISNFQESSGFQISRKGQFFEEITKKLRN